VTRVATGTYDVRFPGMAGTAADPEGIVVNAVSPGGQRCQPGEELIGEILRVNCWNKTFDENFPADVTFVFMMMTVGRAGQRAGYAYVDDSAVLAAGGTLDLPTTKAYNSTGGNVRVIRTASGEFDVVFFGLSPANASKALGVQVVDQDEDDSDTCTIVSWTASAPNLVAKVRCFHTDGTLDDDAFFIIVIE
jgi:hypothetical protein